MLADSNKDLDVSSDEDIGSESPMAMYDSVNESVMTSVTSASFLEETLELDMIPEVAESTEK